MKKAFLSLLFSGAVGMCVSNTAFAQTGNCPLPAGAGLGTGGIGLGLGAGATPNLGGTLPPGLASRATLPAGLASRFAFARGLVGATPTTPLR